ncbi:MAG TPA: hypothetical protein VHI71_01350 [Actinomycetota bacterium]|nr:hypothetical protein [Actinomycetota bacterium]
MAIRSVRWVSVLGIVVLLATVLVWAGPFARGQQGSVRCSLADEPLQPEHPLELNHVASGTLVKTIVMEKEVFVCRDAEGGRILQVGDVETFIEVVEAVINERSVRRLEIGLQVAECTKDFAEGSVRCKGSKRDGEIELLSPNILNFRECQPHESPSLHPRDPVEMETAFLGSQWAKTTKVEKEVLLCGERVVDLYLFTEIVERRTALSGTNQTTMRPVGSPRFFGIVCIKRTPPTSLGSVSTNSCYRFNPV